MRRNAQQSGTDRHGEEKPSCLQRTNRDPNLSTPVPTAVSAVYRGAERPICSTPHQVATIVHRPPSTIQPSSSHRPPSTIHRPPSTVHHLGNRPRSLPYRPAARDSRPSSVTSPAASPEPRRRRASRPAGHVTAPPAAVRDHVTT